MKTTQQKMALALEHYSSGRLRDTEGLCREILDVQPQHAEALHLLGVLAHRTGHVDAAVDLVRRAIANAPHAVEYYSNLGVMLTSQGRLDDAAAACREALGRYPDLPEAHYNLGNALQAAGQLEAAQASYRQALSRKPDYPQAHNNLGNVLSALGSPAAATQAYGEAVRLKPDYAPARSNLANALKNLGHLDEALTQHRRAVESAPTVPEIRSNMILSMYYTADADARAILAESRRWDQLHAEPLRSQIRPLRNDPSPERCLRIGFVSPDLRMHSVAFFLLPLLEAHDRGNFHVTCYATNARADGVTERLRACSDDWRVLVGLSDDAAAQRIRDDRIDILVDLSNHTAGNRLPIFARNPAPVQVTYLGLTGTTGLSSIDYRLTDALVDPPEGRKLLLRKARPASRHRMVLHASVGKPTRRFPSGARQGIRHVRQLQQHCKDHAARSVSVGTHSSAGGRIASATCQYRIPGRGVFAAFSPILRRPWSRAGAHRAAAG
jgi:protein O-GlcNAc transferase